MEILHWEIDPLLERETLNNYRIDFAIGLRNNSAIEIIRELTFDGIAPKISIDKIENLVKLVDKKLLDKKISGVGLEVGGGPGTFSAILAKNPLVSRVFNVEVCKPIVELLGQKVTEYILGDDSGKVTGVVGNFDMMELSDRSIDFIFDFFSLHHSENLNVTLKECHRVLKEDGFILCLDKARPDFYSEKDLTELVDSEYDTISKKRFGVTPDVEFTRRMNGEREYRLKDWESAFKKAGFAEIDYYCLTRITGRFKIIKNLISFLPIRIQKFIYGVIPGNKRNHKFILDNRNKIYSNVMNEFPKDISILIAKK